jgi:hypothetical protein
MSIQSASQLSFGFWQGRTIEIEQVDESISSDGGLIAFKQLDSILGWTDSFSKLIRHSGRGHTAKSMLQQRVFGIIAGYEDQNDHDSLRSDPIFKLIADRSPSDPDLASQPTLSRFENSITASNLLQMEEWFLDRFVESFTEAPERITLDMDTFDDPTHGMQQLTFFHGYYDQYQYQVRVITCAENDMTVLPVLLYGTAAVSLGAYDDIVRVIQKIRARFPDTLIEFRADAGFAVPRMYEALEAIPNVIYTIGFVMSPILRKKSEELLKSTELQYESTRELAKKYMFFPHCSQSWKKVSRNIVIKCEANSEGSNRRAVVTNRPGAEQYPDGTYERYADRGESENRNKELKCGFKADRLSDHRYMANLFRLMMHTLATNMLVCFRNEAAKDIAEIPVESGLPVEARSQHAKRQQHNKRRREDPLGAGHICTWRMMLIKVAARVIVTTRRVRILIPQHWPYAKYLEQVRQALNCLELKMGAG